MNKGGGYKSSELCLAPALGCSKVLNLIWLQLMLLALVFYVRALQIFYKGCQNVTYLIPSKRILVKKNLHFLFLGQKRSVIKSAGPPTEENILFYD